MSRDPPSVEQPFHGDLGVRYADVGIHGHDVSVRVRGEQGEQHRGEDPCVVVSWFGLRLVEFVVVPVDLRCVVCVSSRKARFWRIVGRVVVRQEVRQGLLTVKIVVEYSVTDQITATLE